MKKCIGHSKEEKQQTNSNLSSNKKSNPNQKMYNVKDTYFGLYQQGLRQNSETQKEALLNR